MEKGKDTEHKNLPISTASPFSQQPHHSDAPPSSASSSSSTDRELVQESKKLKQEDDKDTPPSPPRPRIPLSTIPPASHRPLYNNPLSGRPPRSPQSRRPTTGPPSTTTTATSDPISAAQLQPKGYSNPAQFLLNVPDERAHAKFRLDRQRAKKVTPDSDWNGNAAITTQTRHGRSPLGPGPDPYEKVIKVVSDVKEHLNQLKAKKLASKKSSWSSSFSGSDEDSDLEPCTVEEVIRKLEKYLESIPRTASAQEMEDKLLEFQIKVDVDPPPTWYALMRKSTMAFWDNLTDYFVVEALEDSDQEDDMADDDHDHPADKGGKGSSSSGSGFSKAA